MRRVSRLALAFALAAPAGSLACGGGGGNSPAPVAITNNVSIVIVGQGETDLPFNPREARIEAATRQLTEIAGHPLTFEFDVALLPDWRPGFEEALVETLENVARDLKQLKKDRPAAFAYGVPHLERVICRYSALAPDNDSFGIFPDPQNARFDLNAKSVTLTSKVSYSLVPRASVSGAIEDRFEEYLTSRYANKEPEQVPPSERAEYFTYISDSYQRQFDQDEKAYRKTPAGQSEPARPSEIVWIPRVAKLATMVGSSNPELAGKIRKWMFGQMDDFLGAYANDSTKIAAQAAGSRWRLGESAYVAWLNSVVGSLSDDEADIVERNAFVPAFNGGATRFHHEAFPGFDAFAFGLREADAWVQAGHPTTDVEPPARANVFGQIACINNLGRSERCTWLEFTAETPADMGRLADALIARKDAVLTDRVVRGLPGAVRMDFLHLLERDEATLGAGLHGIATMNEIDPAILSDLRHLWRAHPEQRGAILYILTRIDEYADPESDRNSKVGWTKFSQSFDGGASKGDVASYFGQGDDVIPGARLLFAARSSRYSFVDLAVPHLDEWFDSQKRRMGSTRDTVPTLIRLVCSDHDEAGMQQFRDYFARRAASHPGDSLNSTMDSWPKGHCSK